VKLVRVFVAKSSLVSAGRLAIVQPGQKKLTEVATDICNFLKLPSEIGCLQV
jgi:hypothetical protein